MSKPKIAQKEPFIMDLEPGTYAWCACGLSNNQPFCDGAHIETDITPIVFKIDKKKTVALCGCKHSGNKPFCDGTHNDL